ncbi:hypothetical protein GOB57_21740 [Sinorhizobium meliloti]|nr:hypothetical protein [Sinorhizobium meliloti]
MNTNSSIGETPEQAILRFRALRQYIDHEMTNLASTTFRYRSYEFPPKGLKNRLETSFGDMLVKFHAASELTAESGKALDQAYELLALNIKKAEWSFQRGADPEAPDAPWGERTVTNDYPSRYSIKSFAAFVTATTFGVVGFDKYGDRAYVHERTNHPDETGRMSDWQTKLTEVPVGTPGAKSVEEMMEMANNMGFKIIDEYELSEERLTLASEVVEEKPKRQEAGPEAVPNVTEASPGF